MSKKFNKFNPQSSSLERKVNNRSERQVVEDKPLMLFSFKDFQYNEQIPIGHTYSEKQHTEFLTYMLEKFNHICNVNRIEAEQQRFIKVYGEFPENSEFRNPFPNSELDWAVIMKVNGQKGRIAGYVMGHIFYIIYLDPEHKFFPSTLKNT